MYLWGEEIAISSEMASVHDSDASTIVELEIQRLLKVCQATICNSYSIASDCVYLQLQKQSSSSVAVAFESQQIKHITQYCYYMQSAHTPSTTAISGCVVHGIASITTCQHIATS
jgi:hypothetical protein